MTVSANSELPYSTRYPLIDTHTHFDDEVFLADRDLQLNDAWQSGVEHLLLIGYLRRYFERMWSTQSWINNANIAYKDDQDELVTGVPNANRSIRAHVALGLHPLYIDQHSDDDLQLMWSILSSTSNNSSSNNSSSNNSSSNNHVSAPQSSANPSASIMTTGVSKPLPKPIPIGEVGLDTYLPELKQAEHYDKQKRYFIEQLDMAVAHELPVLLHIRKAHADSLRILKQHAYDAHHLGGIAHSFSGGEQEAKAFVQLGFKLGVTGQITNPNAKKLRRAITVAVETFGLDCLVIETDCPDMTPIQCQTTDSRAHQNGQQLDRLDRNVPANLPYVLLTLSEMFDEPIERLSAKLWHNSCDALRVDWPYQP